MAKSKHKLQIAVKALVFNRDRESLILRESLKYKEGTNPGRFDVPGGRIKPGCRYYKNLLREIMEETGLAVKVGRPFHVDEWRPTISGKKLHIFGVYFECFAYSNKVKLSEDHDYFEWIDPRNYGEYPLVPGLEKVFESHLIINGKK